MLVPYPTENLPQMTTATNTECCSGSASQWWVLKGNKTKGYLYEKERQAFYFQVI